MPYVKPDALIGNDQKKIIHTVKGKLGLSDDMYRAVLWGTASVTTSKDLTFRAYWAVMDRLKEIGRAQGVKVFVGNGIKKKTSSSPGTGEGGRGAGGVSSRMDAYREPTTGKTRVKGNYNPGLTVGAMATPAQQAAIWALWEDVARVKTQAGLRHFIENRFKVSDIRFLTRAQASKTIEALKAMQAREIAKGE